MDLVDGQPPQEYRNEFGCNKKTCWGCDHFELTSRKCTRYDKTAYDYVKRQYANAKYDFESSVTDWG